MTSAFVGQKMIEKSRLMGGASIEKRSVIVQSDASKLQVCTECQGLEGQGSSASVFISVRRVQVRVQRRNKESKSSW